ncbi:hypothetical protein PM082_019839 [Marasmius tenuissimus]|nr:hypothetical protein PM082_019839 [Marasmius tenuissimus]
MTQGDGGQRSFWLFEEVVNGGFIKFMDNRSVLIPGWIHLQDLDVSEWLSFTQHVQYICTQKMAFVGDYQGDHQLLTDPQIITHLALGHTFAGGNNPDCYWEMEQWHKCNRYCRHYGLDANWDNIPKASLLEELEKKLNITRPEMPTS